METDTRPNIVFLTCHDTGVWLGCYGHPEVHTPNIDRLAAQGCQFTNSYCASPVCTPSRGAMATGRYPQSNGLMGLIQTPYRWRLNAGERHISHILADAGYHTVLVNHQHEAPHDDRLGFAETRLHNAPTGHPLKTGERVATGAQAAPEIVAAVAARRAADPPVYVQSGFFESHTPWGWNGAASDDPAAAAVPADIADDDSVRAHLAGLNGAVRSLDAAIGAILDGLEQAGASANTLLILASDHGVELPRHKWELYDGGIHTTLLLRWPNGGVSGGAACDWLVGNVDILPSVLELAGIPVPGSIQGRSFAGFFRGESTPARDAVFSMMHRHDRWIESRCVRTATHKLIRNFSPARKPALPVPFAGKAKQDELPVVELYDLRSDPQEMTDLARNPDSASIKDDLDRRLAEWLQEVGDPILQGPVVPPYYRLARQGFPPAP